MKQPKTYKREVAGAMLLAVFGLAIASLFVPNPDQAKEVLKTLVYPVFGFAAVAWGMDAYAKQVKAQS